MSRLVKACALISLCLMSLLPLACKAQALDQGGVTINQDAGYTDNDSAGLLSLEIDDGRAEDYTVWFPALVDNGLVAGFGPVVAWLGKSGRTTTAQYLEMQEAGMEIVCQTYTHDHVPTSMTEFAHETVGAKQALEALGFTIHTWDPSGAWWGSPYFPEVPTCGWVLGGGPEKLLKANFDCFIGQVRYTDSDTHPVPVPSDYRWGGWYGGTVYTLAEAEAAVDSIGPGTGRILMIDGLGRMSAAEVKTLCAYIKAKVDAGKLRVVVPSKHYCPELDTSGSDTTAPTTTASGAVNGRWYNVSVTVSFSATDNAGGTGVDHTEYSLDGGTTWTPGDSLQRSDPALYSVLYRSLDLANNTETAKTLTFGIDTAKPTTKAPYVATAYRGRTATLRYRVNDPAPNGGTAMVTIKVMNAAGKTVKRLGPAAKKVNALLPWSFTVPRTWRAGTYRFYVYAKDKAGNTQTLPRGSNKLVVK